MTPRNRKGEATGNTTFDLNRRASLRPYVATSKRWCVQQEIVLPGQKSEPCSSDGRMAGVSKIPKVLKPIDKVSLGEITSYRAVTTVNANVALCRFLS